MMPAPASPSAFAFAARALALSLAAALLLILAPGCDRAPAPPPGGAPGSATGPAGADPAAPTAKAAGQLNLYIWSEYIPPDVLETFTARTGVKVVVDNYDSNETLLQKLQSGVVDYDICVPTDYMIKILIDQKLLSPLDAKAAASLAHIDPRFLKRPFDPENRFSAPYLWGTTGLGYNKKVITTPIDSWKAMFDPANKGKILMLDDMRECFAVALKSMGKSLNSADPADLRAAADLLKKQKPLVKTYNSNDYDNILAGGDVAVAHGYNGQIAKLVAKEPDTYAYVIPKEGATWSMDALVIPKTAQNPAAAQLFIHFVLEPEINARIVNGVNYASTNAAAKAHIKPEILANPAIYPPDELLAKCEAMEDLGAATETLDRYWTEIKAE